MTYREDDGAKDREIEHLRERVRELEQAFAGIRSYSQNRDFCPFCGKVADGEYYGGNQNGGNQNDVIETRVIETKPKGWFRPAVPAHTVRYHIVCKAEWKEMLPP